MWLASAAWFFPAMLWMAALTPPGYLIAAGLFPCYFGLAAALTPSDGLRRRLVFPGAVAVAELARWSFPFGGVPLANIALSQVNTPLGMTARLAGPLLIVLLVVALGQALNAALHQEWSPVAVAIGITALLVGAAYAHPRSTVVREADIAAIQSGGPTQTRASSDQQPVVLARTIEATKQISGPVDLILWPENVVNPGAYLAMETAEELVSQTAIDYNATLLPGWFFPVNDRTATVNFHTAVWPDGVTMDRYDKVRTVPFGEFVPLRGLIEQFSGEIPAADVIQGTEPPVLDTPVGPVGVAISWEGYFENRSRHAIKEGAQLLTNPTNGSSYWLTQVHTQQIASNQLRALEFDRWVVVAAPTGLSAIIAPDGTVQQRTDIGTREVLQATVEMREGMTLGARVGVWPALFYTLAAAAFSLSRREAEPDEQPDS